MTTTANLFNFIEMLKPENINHITSFDWTLDELEEFAHFLDTLGEYSKIASVHQLYKDFLWWADRYKRDMELYTIEDIDNGAGEDDFFSLKIKVDDMAAELVLYSYNSFYSTKT